MFVVLRPYTSYTKYTTSQLFQDLHQNYSPDILESFIPICIINKEDMDLWTEGNTWSLYELTTFPVLSIIKALQYFERAAMEFAEKREKATYTEDRRNKPAYNKVGIFSHYSLFINNCNSRLYK